MPSALTGTSREFVDTNVFAYAHDLRVPAKRKRALDLIQQLVRDGSLVVSMQVVSELCAVLLRGKVGATTDPADLAALIEEMEASADIITLTPQMAKDAARAVSLYSLAWHDALIWAAARAGGCTVIHTEDTPGQPEIEGVRYENPFASP